jgi:hypothetical protein
MIVELKVEMCNASVVYNRARTSLGMRHYSPKEPFIFTWLCMVDCMSYYQPEDGVNMAQTIE